MPPVITRAEYLEVDGEGAIGYIPLATPAWEILDLSPLWDGPDVIGEDRHVPGYGALSFRREVTASRRALPMMIYGEYAQDGVAYLDPREGLQTNLDYLLTNLVVPPAAGDGTRAAILHGPGGATKTANLQVLSPLRTAPAGPLALRASLEVVIPAGRFV
jgi:hypothetical protein